MRALIIVTLAATLHLEQLVLGLPQRGQRVVCDKNLEFLCSSDNKCIPRTKVCNFVKDCSNGADESRCGGCTFHQNPKRCGLKFIPDRLFAWFRKSPATNDINLHQEHELLSINNDDLELDYYMRLDLNNSILDVIRRHVDFDQNSIYRPKILFPHLKVTNNKDCRFSFQLLITKQPGRNNRINLSQLTPSWPVINMLLVQPKESKHPDEGFFPGKLNREYKSFDLQFNKNNRSSWYTYELPLGQRHTVWTLEIEIEARISSYLTYFGDFKFIDCEPIGGEIHACFEEPTEYPLDLFDDGETIKSCDSPSEFRCKYSGLCIDRSLLCDFNMDCGDYDTSDEDELCDHYPGRCDFETDHFCHWLPSPSSDSWRWMSASEDQQALYGKLPRPPVDHTLKSKLEGGKYLLANITDGRLISSSTFALHGPRVTLKEGASDCNIRFWIFTNQGSSLDKKSLESLNFIRFIVGYEQISGKELFEFLPDQYSSETSISEEVLGLKSSSNFGWKRINIQLLNKDNDQYRSINSLRISLENFAGQVEVFKNKRLMLAIDDISFTPGCHLVERGHSDNRACGEEEHQCGVPTPVSNARCIPIEYYCDFKNDCGRLMEMNGANAQEFGVNIADDELDCPRKCSFDGEEHCRVDIVDGKHLKEIDEIHDSASLNEAFKWLLLKPKQSKLFDDEDLLGHLTLISNFEDFATNYKNQSEVSGKGTQYNLKNIRVQMPTFSKAHANCQFELQYRWSSGSNNIHAYILLATDESEILVKKIQLPPEMRYLNASRKRQTIVFGIGYQVEPFKLIIEIAIQGTMSDMMTDQPYGVLHLISYQFISCSFYPGVIDASDEEEFADEVEAALGHEGQVDLSDQYKSGFDLSCPEAFFQCIQPIVCIPENLVCDMQVDCQGGLDEKNCDKYVRFNFETEDPFEFEREMKWWNDGRERTTCGLTWNRVRGSRFLDRSADLGPPYDHSKSRGDGWYLRMSNRSSLSQDYKPELKNVACLRSPEFEPDLGCRLVLYIYFWSAQKLLDKFEIFNEGQLLYEINSTLQQYDRWQRIELEIERKGKPMSVLLKAQAGQGKSGLITLDDISFSPECNLKPAFSVIHNGNGQKNTTISELYGNGSNSSKQATTGAKTIATVLVTIPLIALMVAVFVSLYNADLLPSAAFGSSNREWVLRRWSSRSHASSLSQPGPTMDSSGHEHVELSNRNGNTTTSTDEDCNDISFEYRRLSRSSEENSKLDGARELQ